MPASAPPDPLQPGFLVLEKQEGLSWARLPRLQIFNPGA
jgi:hypothetical protein